MAAVVDWLEPPDSDTGVDHLGMRVAGEKAYNQLIDFTTTVTWRARYFSFLCWSVREAWRRQSTIAPRNAQGQIGVSINAWHLLLKRWDYVIAAATLADRPRAERIGGQRKIAPRLRQLAGSYFEFDTDHLETRSGSFDVYVGVLRLFDLARSPDAIDIVSPVRGEELAQAFERSLDASGVRQVLDADGAEVGDLARLGRICGVDQLAEAALVSSHAAAEQALLREIILDWKAFGGGHGRAAGRILTAGLILEAHRLIPNVTLEEFRSLMLLGHTVAGAVPVRLDLPAVFDSVRAQWRSYQTHAYATFALEVFLEVMLEVAFKVQGDRDNGVPIARLLSELTTALYDSDQNEGLPFSPESSVEDFTRRVATLQSADTDQTAEPTLVIGLENRKDTPLGTTLRSAFLLLVSCIVRANTYRADEWRGDTDERRLPPSFLVKHLNHNMRDGMTVAAYLEIVLTDLVVKQHVRNALRKLAGDPSKYSVLFTIEDGRLFPLKPNQAGTSDPRFRNAARMLRDIGLLAADGGSLTEEGATVFAKMASAAP